VSKFFGSLLFFSFRALNYRNKFITEPTPIFSIFQLQAQLGLPLTSIFLLQYSSEYLSE